jgi:assimilatory nitrate reductase catalytic subunit
VMRSTSGSACRRRVSATTRDDVRAIEEHGGIQWPFPRAPRIRRRHAACTGRRVSDRRWQGAAVAGKWEPFPSSRTPRFPRAQHRADGRALAHANEDGQRADPRASVAECVARDEPARRAPARLEAAGPCRRRVAARARARRRAARDRDHRARPGLRAVSLRRGERQQVTQSAFDPISREPNYKQSQSGERSTPKPNRQLPNGQERWDWEFESA